MTFAVSRRLQCTLAAHEGAGRDVVVCDVAGVQPSAVAVDVLARLQLAAGRAGARVVLRNASHELLELIAFSGLGDVLAEA